MRIMVDTTKPLATGCWVTRYERLPNFCYKCGRIGHVSNECFVPDGRGDAASYRDWTRTRMIKDLPDAPRMITTIQGVRRQPWANKWKWENGVITGIEWNDYFSQHQELRGRVNSTMKGNRSLGGEIALVD
ncbi:hypothetical protein D8674_006019 [Pyrus ussuriensis x Pyrus communis]|uniref:CCHC-type domain-containing protein n=1 Tax=Pyrus ussuriensis x Pyrus communis TaxID=2448454 RepID=A0A5N5FYS1_9ROSA|nr:hypothetical protein D8674_006019 [Pyrus ussuriensis x Pyrus communis]